MIDLGALSLDEAADALGVPAVQLIRWCRDGLIGPEHFIGSVWAAENIRFEPDALPAVLDALNLTRIPDVRSEPA